MQNRPLRPQDVQSLIRRRLEDQARLRRQDLQRRRETKLYCPDCLDSFKIKLNGKWYCRHCLSRMILPAE